MVKFRISFDRLSAEEHLSVTASAWLAAGCSQQGEFFCWGALSELGGVPIFRNIATGDSFLTEVETSSHFSSRRDA